MRRQARCSRPCRPASVAGGLGAVLVAALVVAGANAAPSVAAKATLKVVKLKPLTVRGTGFKSGERVTFRLSAGLTGTARATATAAGAVVAVFPKAKATSCTSYALRAVGASGTRVTFKATSKGSCKAVAAVKLDGPTVVIAGTRFRPGEKVTVTFVANEEPHTQHVRASSKGTFRVDLGALPVSGCSAYKLTVMGSLGSRVSMSQDALPC